MKCFTLILRLLLSALFLWAGGSKLYTLLTQSSSINQSMFEVYLGTTGPWRYLVCILEIVLGGWLLLNRPRHWMWKLPGIGGIALLLLALFTTLIIIELFKDNPVPCGCGVGEYAHWFAPLPATTNPALWIEGVPPRDLRPIRLALAVSLLRNIFAMLMLGYLLDRARLTSSPAKPAGPATVPPGTPAPAACRPHNSGKADPPESGNSSSPQKEH